MRRKSGFASGHREMRLPPVPPTLEQVTDARARRGHRPCACAACVGKSAAPGQPFCVDCLADLRLVAITCLHPGCTQRANPDTGRCGEHWL